MKRTSSAYPAARAACTVSAAALMLGVSQAATVGFHFQTHYCSAESYTGAIVTAPAFGVGTNSWENLTPFDTGYGCDPGPFTLTEKVDTTTSGGGLNPLPSGAVTVTWTGYVANVSGFGGYDRPGPHYTFGGNGYQPGEEQVYWGFLRDGVNFGPGSSGGDNDKPGYSVDLTGMKSLFPNGPFVVQLIATSDSLSSLTNAFIIDAATGASNAVAYPNIPPIANVNDTAWPRGVGGGLSTVSSPVDTDHLQIVGARAAHSAGPPAFNFASTISGFIVTDKPVVTMSPQPVTGGLGDTITLRAIAAGVPPMTRQWRKDGKPIAGATNDSFTIAAAAFGDTGSYDLALTNAYGSATSKAAAVIIDQLKVVPASFTEDSKPTGSAADAAVFGAVWESSEADSASLTRSGVLKFSAVPGAQAVAPGTPNFDSAQGTISFWIKSGGTNAGAGNEGAMILDRRTSAGLVIVKKDDGTLEVQPTGGSGNTATTTTTVDDGKWHHVAVTYDQTAAGGIEIYLGGTLESSIANASAWSWPAGQEIELGRSHDSYWRPLEGSLDEVRIYNRMLTATEVASLATDAVVDAAALQLRLNFGGPLSPGVGVSWQSQGLEVQSADAVSGPYTDTALQTSPMYLRAAGSKKFFRGLHTPATVVANPYDM